MTGDMQVVSGTIGHEKVHFQAPNAANVVSKKRTSLLHL
jgi:hypothetical protein